ncbi:MAG: tail tape measure protein [Pelagibacterium sp.]|uniref:phage tail tape measure protein n=1 Tax=Pelagibacterium sp. TaxID=1967288 RepID=UPI0032EDB541
MAGEGDAERLVVLLEARIRDFEKNMAKASGTATKSYGRMRKDSTTATGRMERDMVRSTGRINQALAMTSSKIGGFGKAMIGGLVGGLAAGGVAGLVSSIGRVATAVAEVGDQARMAGVDFESFQELKYVAEQNRIGVDALTDGLKELNLRADEFIVTGGGSAAEAFERLGYTSEELARKLEDPSALFTEIIGKLGDLDRAAQIRIADEIFGGTGGERFVQLIEQGEQGLRDTVAEARNLGKVLSEDTLVKANELDQAFKNVASTVGTTLQNAIVNASWALYDFLQQFQAVENRTTASLESRMREVGAQRIDLEHAILEQSSALRNLESEFGPNFQGIGGPQVAIESNIAGLRDEMAAIVEEERAILDVLNSRTPIEPPPSRITVGGPGGEDDDTGGGGRSGSSIDSQLNSLNAFIAALEMERELIGLSAVDQEKLAALREHGAMATQEQKDRIAELIQTISDEKAAAELVTSDGAPWELLGQQMAGLESMLDRGAISWEEYGAAAQRAHMLAASSTLGAVGQITGALSQIFEGNKGFAVANAVVNTAQGITAALALPPPMGWIQAAAVAASGAAQISTIMSTQKGSTAKPSVSGGGSSSSGSSSAPTAPQQTTQVNVTLGGRSMFSRDDLSSLLEQIADGLSDGVGTRFKVEMGK